MISRAEYIQQPYSGEYIEKIYDIKSPWNSTDWTWIKFTEEDAIWCGEFRGKYRGVDEYVILDDNTFDFANYPKLWERLLLTNGIENAEYASKTPAIEAMLFLEAISY